MNNYKVFVINLERSKDRMRFMKQQLDAQGIPFEQISAVDGRLLTDDEIQQATEKPSFPRFYASLSTGEIGCYLSHRLAWQRIIDKELDWALILEDDVELQPGFFDLVKQTMEEGTTPFLHLDPRQRELGKQIRKIGKGHALFHTPTCPLRACAYALTNQQSQTLCDKIQATDRPVDTRLQMAAWQGDLVVHALHPLIVRQLTQTELPSDIRPRKESPLKRLRRGILRPLYRLTVSILSRKAGKTK